jgi:hypothetical protein
MATEVTQRHNRGHYGRFLTVATPGYVPPPQARLVAVTLADQVGTTPS